MSGTLRTNVLDSILLSRKGIKHYAEILFIAKAGWGPWGDQGRFGQQSLNTQYAQLMPVGFHNSSLIGCIRAIFFYQTKSDPQ